MFERAVALTPLDARSWGNLADAQRGTPGLEGDATRSLDRAIALVDARLSTNPRDADGWSRRAKWLAKRGRIAESLADVKRALELAPDNVNVKARAVTVYHLAGDLPRALACLDAAIRAGYGMVEFERDPELEELRNEPGARQLLAQGRSRTTGTSCLEPDRQEG
jgi:tetratricopeptide (TPR) repeat protein